jgi:hypothetical protein
MHSYYYEVNKEGNVDLYLQIDDMHRRIATFYDAYHARIACRKLNEYVQWVMNIPNEPLIKEYDTNYLNTLDAE